MTAERWLPIQGHEGVYEISDLGRVRRLRTGHAPRILQPYPNTKGYLLIGLGWPRLTIGVHRLVLMAFVGMPPSDTHQGNHIDGDKLNNALSNLEWVTPSENMQHAVAHGLHVDNRGERNGRAKLTAGQIIEIRCLHGSVSQRELGRRYGVSKSLINKIVLGQVWREEMAA